MEQINHSVGQENPPFYGTRRRSPPLVPILSQMHPALTFPPKVHFSIILTSTPRSRKWFLPSGFPANILYDLLISSMRATCPAHLIRLDVIALMTPVKECRLWNSKLCVFVRPPLTSSLKLNIALITII